MNSFDPFSPDPAVEAKCRERVRQYLIGQNRPRVERNLDDLFSLQDVFRQRFNYILTHVPDGAKRRLLVSGCAAGSELIVARNCGFQEMFGTEIVPEYVSICQERLVGVPACQVNLYDGSALPYADESFSTIVSGHIIEHTPSPFDYLREHLRVLQSDGWLCLEFPTRYHYRELHTLLPSVEWLPLPLRNAVLHMLSWRFTPLPADVRKGFRAVRETLMPVSVRQIKSYLRRLGNAGTIRHADTPVRGCVRLMVQKR